MQEISQCSSASHWKTPFIPTFFLKLILTQLAPWNQYKIVKWNKIIQSWHPPRILSIKKISKLLKVFITYFNLYLLLMWCAYWITFFVQEVWYLCQTNWIVLIVGQERYEIKSNKSSKSISFQKKGIVSLTYFFLFWFNNKKFLMGRPPVKIYNFWKTSIYENF